MKKNREENSLTGFEIAAIGMDARFPGAGNITEFWNNLKGGVESIQKIDQKELDSLDLSSEIRNSPNYVNTKGGVLAKKECFDAEFFDYSPREAEVMEPQLRLFHECSWHALEDAGYVPDAYEGDIGIYAGSTFSLDWHSRCILSGKSNQLGEFVTLQLVDKDFLCMRTAYKLNLKGPAVVVQSTCSTSLVAIHTACRALLMGECDMALAGGVSVSSVQRKGYLYQEGMINSPDGHCRAFDQDARGTIAGEGIGVVVLKRLKYAIKDKDHIYAVVKGSAINNDGKEKIGFTAPGMDGQVRVIEKAHRVSRVSAESITYVEAHGTGTQIGDPIEVKALNRAFNTDKKRFCGIGSVKTNIGHLNSAAGVAGFIKTVLSLYHRLLVPSLNFVTPNSNIDFENTPFYVNTQLQKWENHQYPLRAGINSFGMGGTNAHVVLEEAPALLYEEAAPDSFRQERQLILLSACTKDALEQMTQNLVAHFAKHPGLELADVAFTLQVGRKSFRYRKKLLCSNINEAVEALSNNESRKVRLHGLEAENPKIVFIFPGLGGQYINMASGLYRRYQIFRDEMDTCFEYLQSLWDYDIKAILYPGEGENDVLQQASFQERLNQIEFAQVTVFCVEYALSKMLIKWGVQPNVMIGYSFGEYAAGCLAGVFTLENALKLIVARGKLISDIPPGGMLSVPLPAEQVKPLLNNDLCLAIENGPSSIVAGPAAQIDAFEKEMKKKKYLCIPLAVSHAIHSTMMVPIEKAFKEKVKQIPLNKSKIPYISNVTGNYISDEEATDPNYWAAHLTKTVRFADGIKRLTQKENVIFLDVGPGRDIGTMISRQIQGAPGQHVVNILGNAQKRMPEKDYLLSRLGDLWLYGKEIDWKNYYTGQERRRVPLPGYPFRHIPYWLADVDLAKARNVPQETELTRRKPDMADWFYSPLWEQSPAPPFKSGLSSKQENWLVFCDDCGVADNIVNRLDSVGHHVIKIKAGNQFKQCDNDVFTIEPRRGNHYDTVINELREKDWLPHRVLHFWGITGNPGPPLDIDIVDSFLDLGFYSVLHLVQSFGRENIINPVQLDVVTDRMLNVTGHEPGYPPKAVVLGAIKIIPLEYSTISCRHMDIELPEPGESLHEKYIDLLFHEIIGDTAEKSTALRGNHRWVQSLKPIRLEKSEGPSPLLKEKGVYLITGGMGGMGFTFAEFLAKEYRSHLILVGRSSFPKREAWQKWLDSHPEDDGISRKINKIIQWEEHGAKVMVLSADVSKERDMVPVIEQAHKMFGSINGVLHAAGIIDYKGVIQRRNREMNERVMAPKINGTLVLDHLLKDEQLDFMILFSSVANYAYGVKFGQVGYNAANEFLDSFADFKSGNSTFIASINWTDWLEVGMAIKAINKRHQDDKEFIDYKRRLPDAVVPTEGIEVLKRVLDRRLHRVAVSTLDLLTVMKYVNRRRFGNKDFIHDLEQMTDSNLKSRKPQLDTEYIAPRSPIEKKLVHVFQEYFGIHQIGIHDDFFELGGDSLKAMVVISRIHKALNVEVPLMEFFNKSNIEGLAEYVRQAKKCKYFPIKSAPPNEYYPLSSVQKRLYILNQADPGNLAYNETDLKMIEGQRDLVKLETAVKRLIQRHESLRTSFQMVDGEPVQKVHHEVDFRLEVHSLEKENQPMESAESTEERLIHDFIRPFDLARPPMLRVGIILVNDTSMILMIDIHHIIADGVSYGILMKDFITLHEGESLPPLKIQYKDFAYWQVNESNPDKSNRQESFWLEHFAGTLPILNLPIDFVRPEVQCFLGNALRFELFPWETKALRKIAADEDATIYITLLTVFYVFLYKLTMQQDVIVGTSLAGRMHPDLEQIIGMFVNNLALRNYPRGEKTFRQFLIEVRDRTMEAFENQHYPLEELVRKVSIKSDRSRNSLFDVMFVLNNEKNLYKPAEVTLSLGKLKHYKYFDKASQMDLKLRVIEREQTLHFKFEYSTALFKEDTIRMFIDNFREIVAAVVKNTDIRLHDISTTHDVLSAEPGKLRHESGDFNF